VTKIGENGQTKFKMLRYLFLDSTIMRRIRLKMELLVVSYQKGNLKFQNFILILEQRQKRDNELCKY
jgi:hypothetical protein